MKFRNRLLAMLLVSSMVLSLIPLQVFAEEGDSVPENVPSGAVDTEEFSVPDQIIGGDGQIIPDPVPGDEGVPDLVPGDEGVPDPVPGDGDIPDPVPGDEDIPDPVPGDEGSSVPDGDAGPQAVVYDSFTWNDESGVLSDGVFCLSTVSADNQIDFDTVVSMMPPSITLDDGRTVDVTWTSDSFRMDPDGNWPYTGDHVFTAAPAEEITFSEKAPRREILLKLSGEAVTWTAAPDSDFEFESWTGTILKYKGSDTVVEIPAAINGKNVTAIDDYAFKGCSQLTSVTIPDSVTSIGWGAFYQCSKLKSVTIPGSVDYIKGYTFYGCYELESVTISQGVTSIGENAFKDCSRLTSVVIPQSVTSIGSSAFHSCTALSSVVIPNGVTSIENHTFNTCESLTSVIIPEGVTSIGQFVFSFSGLTRVSIPASIQTIDPLAFYYCGDSLSVLFSGTREQWNTLKPSFPENCKVEFGSVDPESGLLYEEGADAVTIVDGSGATGSVTIPEKINGKPVMYMKGDAFSGSSATHVTVNGDLILQGDMTIPAGKTLTVKGSLTGPALINHGTLIKYGDISGLPPLSGGGRFCRDGTPTDADLLIPPGVTASMPYTGQVYAAAADFRLNAGREYNCDWEFAGWTGKLTRDGKPAAELKDAGTYVVTFSKTGEAATVTRSFTVTPAAITGNAQNVELVYNGKDQTVTVIGLHTVNDQPITVKYGRREDSCNLDTLTVKDAAPEMIYYYKAAAPSHTEKTGSFTVTVRKSETWFEGSVKAYRGGTESAVFTYGDTITVKAKPAATGVAVMRFALTEPAPNQMALYVGNIQISEAVSAGPDGVYEMTLNTKDPAVAEKLIPGQTTTVTAKYVDSDNLAEHAETLDLTVNKAQGTASVTLADWTYGDTPNIPVPVSTTNGTGSVTCLYTGKGCSGHETPVNAGTYRVTATFPATAGYNAVTAFADFTIHARSIQPTVPDIPEQEITGSQLKPEVTVKDGNRPLVLNQDYTLSYGENKYAGSGTVTVRAMADGNYSFADVVKNFTIVKAVYGGTRTATVQVPERGYTGRTVILPAVPQGASMDTPTCSPDAGLTDLSAVNGVLTFTAAPHAAGETETIIVPVSATEKYQDYSIQVTVQFVAGELQNLHYETGNLSRTYGDISFTNPLTRTMVKGTVTYETSDPAVAAVNEATGEVTVQGVGSAVITARAAETAEYAEATASYTLNVAQKPVTVTATVRNKDYDNKTEAQCEATSLKGILEADKNAVKLKEGTASFENAAAGKDKKVTFQDFALEGSAAANYSLIQPAPVTAEIRKADYDMRGVSFTDGTAVYDGKSHSLTISGTLPTGLDGKQVTVSYSGSATNVSEGPVTVTAAFAAGSTNYNVPASMTAKITISGAPIGAEPVSVTAPAAGDVPETAFSGDHYTGAITWDGAMRDGSFGYHTVYTAHVTLTPDENYSFNGEAADATGLTGARRNQDGTITGSKTFEATRKARILSAEAPVETPHYLPYCCVDAREAANYLPGTMTIQAEDGTTSLPVKWTLPDSFNTSPDAENRFSWQADCGDLDPNGNITGGVCGVFNGNLKPVHHSGKDRAIAYDGRTWDVRQLFTLDPHAGSVSYSIVSLDSDLETVSDRTVPLQHGAGTLEGSMLTITKVGPIRIQADTAAAGDYAAGTVSAVLTVNKGQGSGSVTMDDGYIQGPANEPVPVSSTNGIESVVYRYIDKDNGQIYQEKPTWPGIFIVEAVFAATDFYNEVTAQDEYQLRPLPQNVQITPRNFPDYNFREYIENNVDRDSNGVLFFNEILSVQKIQVPNLQIKTLKGVEIFVELQDLDCRGNLLTQLDLQHNTNLKNLNCSGNQLTALELSRKLDSMIADNNAYQSPENPVRCSSLPGSPEAARIEQVTGGSLDRETGTFTPDPGSTEITYHYDCGLGQMLQVSIGIWDHVLYTEDPELQGQSEAWVDGVCVPVIPSGNGVSLALPGDNCRSLVTYTYHTDGVDPHKQYPTGMKVWILTEADGVCEATRIRELDNLLTYAGCSIRLKGTNGIRMITGIDTGKKAALTGTGLAGCTLLEYGTVIARSNNLSEQEPVLGGAGCKSNYAYKKGVADPVFRYANGQTQYTNVLVGFSMADCSQELSMRPYILLEDSEGQQIPIYGGTVRRSIHYIAKQNQNAFPEGSPEYEFVWNIILNADDKPKE